MNDDRKQVTSMPEHQTIEYKETWHDEFLEWTCGYLADVNLLYENGLQYIEIILDKYLALISYHGKYFYRSGRTMRTITGKELDKAILKSQGRTWDGMPIPKLQVADLRKEVIDKQII